MDNGVLLEYQLPLTSKRLDCMVTGTGSSGSAQAVIVELKQWDVCEQASGPNEVATYVGGAVRDVLHPSSQVGQYRSYLEDSHTAFNTDPGVLLSACSYLHNYFTFTGDPLFAAKFQQLIATCPVFTADDVDPLTEYLTSSVGKGDSGEILHRIEQSKYKPSRKLLEHVNATIAGKTEYVLLDEQLIAFDAVMNAATEGVRDRSKRMIIVKGGPGTGKSVVALNLLGQLSGKHLNAHYVTGSKAFTTTVRAIVGTRAAQQVKYFNGYVEAQPNDVDVMICDEAHRIRATSNNQYTPAIRRSNLPQIAELMRAAKTAVFFIDDNQVVRPGEVGSVNYLTDFAASNNYSVTEFQLEAQFRCAGSDGFINWVNNTLGIERTANVLWNSADERFDFRIFESPADVENAIREKAREGNSARMTAGFCWDWSKPNPDGSLVEDVQIGEYRRPWNARSDAGRLAPGIPKESLWAYDPNGIDQVGCVYTAQGFEFDYVGVIFGDDLAYDPVSAEWVGDRNRSADSVVRRSPASFLTNVKNTYRVLLSRGMKGCYVCFTNSDTKNFFRSRLEIENVSR